MRRVKKYNIAGWSALSGALFFYLLFIMGGGQTEVKAYALSAIIAALVIVGAAGIFMGQYLPAKNTLSGVARMLLVMAGVIVAGFVLTFLSALAAL